ncbi:MAG: competence protein ComEC [Parcubacteria bacterium C7867-008]|nr:MAG: competence protein ComEC [Parcubacteria bacterium C7867-008]
MGAPYFYAAVSGFLSGIFLESVHSIPTTVSIVFLLLGFFCGVQLFTFRKTLELKHQYLFVLCVALVAFGIGTIRTHYVPTRIPYPFASLLGTKSVVEGVIVVPPDTRESSNRLTVEIEQGGESTRIIASASLRDTYHVGDRVRVTGTIKSPEPFDGDGGRVFRYDQFLAKDGVFGLASPANVEIVGRDTRPWFVFLRSLEYVKDGFVRAIRQSIPEPESALAIGILAGGKQGLGAQLLDAFTITGMLQIVVLSGYNVMIVAEGVLVVLRKLPKKTALILAALVIALFVLAAGAGTAAVRAGIMALIALFARGAARTYDVLRSLFVALVLMLLVNPSLLVFDPGLQLSFMATLGLILGSTHIGNRLHWIHNPTLHEMVATTLAAQAAVLPVLLYQSGNLSFVAIPANLLAMPVLPAAMAASALSAVCAFLFSSYAPLIALIAGVPAYLLLTYVIHIAEIGASVPFANVIIPAFSAWLLIPTYGILGWWVWKQKEIAPHTESAGRFYGTAY